MERAGGQPMKGRSTRRWVLRAAAGVVFLPASVSLAGCGASGGGSATAAEQQPIKLLFGRRSSAAEQPVLEKYIAGYRQVAPHVTVETVSLPAGLQEMRQGLITGFAAGTGPDTFISDGPWLPEFATIGLLDAMPDHVSRDLKANF